MFINAAVHPSMLFRITAFCALMAVIPVTHAASDGMPEVKDLPVHPEIPDVMTMADGTKVTTPGQWQVRRKEMKRILEYYELGHVPPPPGNVSGEDIQSRAVLDGAAKFRLVHLKFGPDEKLGFDVAIFTPAKGGPFPTIINPSFFSTPGVNFTSSLSGAIRQSPTTNPPAGAAENPPARPRLHFNAPVDPERAASSFSNQLDRGYAIVTYRYTQCGEDNTNFLNSSYYPAYPGYDWGLLYVVGRVGTVARGGLSGDTTVRRLKTKLIVLGHSRLGKLAMVATAFRRRTHCARRTRRLERRGHGGVSFLRPGSWRQGRH